MTTAKNGQQKLSKEAEALATAIDNLIIARLAAMHSPGMGSEAADNQHKELAEELKRAL